MLPYRHLQASRRRAFVTTLVALTALGGAGVAGCGQASPSQQVRATLDRLGRATAAKDYHALCTTVLAPMLVQGVIKQGLPCERALALALNPVRSPQLTVRRITVNGSSAQAAVHSTAANQAPFDGTLALTKVAGQWRVASLVG